jgi:hypothetical protein
VLRDAYDGLVTLVTDQLRLIFGLQTDFGQPGLPLLRRGVPNPQRNRAWIAFLAIGREVREADRLPTIPLDGFWALEQTFAEAAIAPVQRVRTIVLCQLIASAIR